MTDASETDASKAELSHRLIAACPSFAARWNEYLATAARRGDEVNAISAEIELAEHLVDQLVAGRTDEFGPIFEVIESLNVGDDPWLAEIFSGHFVDELQTNALRHGDWNFANQFRPWLGVRTLEYWKALYYNWKSEHGLPPTL
jgi:hypothetical protein